MLPPECDHQFTSDDPQSPCIWCNITLDEYTLVSQGQLSLF